MVLNKTVDLQGSYRPNVAPDCLSRAGKAIWTASGSVPISILPFVALSNRPQFGLVLAFDVERVRIYWFVAWGSSHHAGVPPLEISSHAISECALTRVVRGWACSSPSYDHSSIAVGASAQMIRSGQIVRAGSSRRPLQSYSAF